MLEFIKEIKGVDEKPIRMLECTFRSLKRTCGSVALQVAKKKLTLEKGCAGIIISLRSRLGLMVVILGKDKKGFLSIIPELNLKQAGSKNTKFL